MRPGASKPIDMITVPGRIYPDAIAREELVSFMGRFQAARRSAYQALRRGKEAGEIVKALYEKFFPNARWCQWAVEDAKSTIESQQELFNAIADKEFTIGKGYYMKIVKPGESLPYELGIMSGKYQKKWTATLSAPLAVKGNSGDTAFVVTFVLEAFGTSKECWHWDDKNQVLTMRAADDPTGNYGPKDPADRVRYIQIQAGTPHIKWVFERGSNSRKVQNEAGGWPYKERE
ncbi:hypothetical protein [Desulfofundulus thermocisternus]|uniref:hypothetical protein n=1 Tax=Desulfofundulus thermocisternus TaxID=42471 RepID=UPI00217EA9E9|nr:hypothetical protein [Desulfofundulus thermocisternus]MCS5694731.1 hypothetical protein [Desulfofundulus thermocisternus]